MPEHAPRVDEPPQIEERSQPRNRDDCSSLPCSAGGEEVFLDFLILLDDPHQFWGDRVKESLEEFCHASSLHG